MRYLLALVRRAITSSSQTQDTLKLAYLAGVLGLSTKCTKEDNSLVVIYIVKLTEGDKQMQGHVNTNRLAGSLNITARVQSGLVSISITLL